MGGGIAAGAEVAQRGNQAAPEQVRPDTIGPDASGEWIAAAGDCIGHFAAAAAMLEGGRLRLVFRSQNAEKMPLDRRARTMRIAAQENRLTTWLLGVGKHGRRVVARRFVRVGE